MVSTLSFDDRCWAAELALLNPDVRANRETLEALLAEEFHEIGQSGSHWTRAEIIEALSSRPESLDSRTLVEEKRADLLGPDLVLLTYHLTFNGRHSRRSSIWRLVGDRVELVFHQGTPLPG